MAREEYKSDVSDLVAVSKVWNITNFKRGITA
jgi:hypothetical protein